MEPAWAIGLMTGTALDGFIDIAMLRTDGETITEFGPWELAPYETDLRPLLRQTFEAARAWNFTGPEPAIFREAELELTTAQSHAVTSFLTRHGVTAADVAAVGFHGQTVLHAVPQDGGLGHTRQLGDGALMARLTGIDTVFDFRSADVAAGGQGAPLAPIYHKAMLDRIGAGPETVILNLGGVANISMFDGLRLMAFDTGPANAPVNDWVRGRTGAEMDEDGLIAAGGTVDEALLARLLTHPYLTAPFPKSLDRFDFTAAMAEGLGLEDGAATLTAFSAAAVGKALDLLAQPVRRIIVSGGGRRNPQMMKEIARRTGATVISADEVGLRGDAVEAECFAFLAMRSLRGLPLSFPLTTGVPAPQTGGRIARASRQV